MRNRLLGFLRVHPGVLGVFWKLGHCFFSFLGLFIPLRKKTMLITSFAGRKYNDSPKALYEEILKRKEFEDWEIIWAFVKPDEYDIPRGKKIKIDSISFFLALLYCRVWISNSGMDRNLDIRKKGIIKIETWHGAPIKMIGEDQKTGTLGDYKPYKETDRKTLRCAQSKYDRDIMARVFNADRKCFIMADLPRNDKLLKYSQIEKETIIRKLNLPKEKRILLYMPTYREFLTDFRNQTYQSFPIDLGKWKSQLGKKYVLLIRAHYVVSKIVGVCDSEFVRDVSDYEDVNDLYAVSDMLISDYSSAFIDYSILEKPMICFAYDEDEYREKRGLYFELEKELPCPVNKDEDSVIQRITNMDYRKECMKVHDFHMKYAPFAGHAGRTVVNCLINQLKKTGGV